MVMGLLAIPRFAISSDESEKYINISPIPGKLFQMNYFYALRPPRTGFGECVLWMSEGIRNQIRLALGLLWCANYFVLLAKVVVQIEAFDVERSN